MLRLLGRVAGRRCPVCAAPTGQGESLSGLCGGCAVELAPRLAGFCPGCGELTAVADMPPTLCGACSVKPRPWSAFGFYGVYEGALRGQILALKFGSHLGPLGLLRQLLMEAYRLGCERAGGFDVRGPEVITAVPLHWRKLLARGFNQSVELAKGLATGMVPELSEGGGAVLRPEALRKVRATVAQSRLRAAERRANLSHAFVADAALVHGRRVLVVDDVLTTGSTMEVAVNTLLSAGAARVEVLVLARDEKKCLTHAAELV